MIKKIVFLLALAISFSSTQVLAESMRVKASFLYPKKQDGIKIWVDDLQNPFTGESYLEYPQGGLKEVKHYVDGKQEGKSTSYYLNGNKRTEENWKEGKLSGLSTYYNPDGSIAVKTLYKDGRKNGESKNYHKNGRVLFAGNYKDGQLDGIAKHYNEQGILTAEQYWDNGKEQPVLYFELVKRGDDSDDEQIADEPELICTMEKENDIFCYDEDINPFSGTAYTKYSTGHLWAREEFANGKRNGVAKYYADNGVLLAVKTFENNQVIEHKVYYENGTLQSEAVFKNSQVVMQKTYYPNGQLQMQADEYAQQYYYDNGQLRLEKSRLKGETVAYTPEGNAYKPSAIEVMQIMMGDEASADEAQEIQQLLLELKGD